MTEGAIDPAACMQSMRELLSDLKAMGPALESGEMDLSAAFGRTAAGVYEVADTVLAMLESGLFDTEE